MNLSLLLLPVLLAACAIAPREPPAPRVDHHQHVFSPALATVVKLPVLAADELVPLLDAAGIERAALLSAAYINSRPGRVVVDEYARVRADNDWTFEQAQRFPGRFRAFCGLNPLREHALQELERCAANPRMGRAIKMHFGNSDVRLEDPGHFRTMRDFFAAANARGMGLVVHLRASISLKRPYGREQALAFLELLASAPDVPVMVAHFAGSGPGYQDPAAHDVMAVLAEAMARRDPRTRNLWVDVASIAHPSMSDEQRAHFAARIRQAGVERVVYGTDSAVGNNLRPREAWAEFRRLPLAGPELRTIAGNVVPFMR